MSQARLRRIGTAGRLVPPPVDNSWLPYSAGRTPCVVSPCLAAIPVRSSHRHRTRHRAGRPGFGTRHQRPPSPTGTGAAAEQEALEQIDLLRADDALVAEMLAEIQGLVDAQTRGRWGAAGPGGCRIRGPVPRATRSRRRCRRCRHARGDCGPAVDSYVGTDTPLEPWLESG